MQPTDSDTPAVPPARQTAVRSLVPRRCFCTVTRVVVRQHPQLRAVILTLMVLAYPLLVYIGLERFGARWISLTALTLVALQWFLMRGKRAGGGQIGSTAQVTNSALRLVPLLGLWIAATISGDEHLLMLVPALGSFIFGLLFAASLSDGRVTWIERVARLTHDVSALPPRAVSHCRLVTGLWSVFLIANGLASGALALFGPRAWWAFYSGFLAYIFVGLLMGGEYFYRMKVVRPVADREARELGMPVYGGAPKPEASGAVEDQPVGTATGGEGTGEHSSSGT
ncbi:MAG: putative membrane protein [Planctomycetota bacterium]|jgi:uncharacterized membrane protein